MSVLILINAFIYPSQNLTHQQQIPNEPANIIVPFTLHDRDRLISVEKDIALIREQIRSTNEQIKPTNQRIVRLEDLQSQTVTIIITSTISIIELIVTIIEFILWDRKTFMRSAEKLVKERDEEIQKNRRILDALRELYKTDEKVAALLYHLL